jgi:hypothetical protein
MASIFDAFSGPNTAGPQIAGLQQAYSSALPAIMARLSIHFFLMVAVIDIWIWGWSHERDEWAPTRHLLHLDISAKRLPKLASALARATRFGLEQGLIPAGWAVGTEFEKESTDKQHSTDMQAQTP